MIYTGKDKNLFDCEGNLTKDIEFVTNNNGEKTVAFFYVCTCRKSKVKDISDRHFFVVKGDLIKSEILDKLKKGTRVHAQGVLTYVMRKCVSFPSAEIQCTNVELI